MAGAFGMVTEPLRPKRPDLMSDETIGSFIERRVDKRIANNLVSAVFHGIYAGDIWKLSAKTLLATAWHLEGRYGSALGGFFRMQSESQSPNPQMLIHPFDAEAVKEMNEEFDIGEDLVKKMRMASTFTFKKGLQQLVNTLQEAVEKTGNVQVKVDSPVQSTTPLEDGQRGVQVTTGVRPNLPHSSLCPLTNPPVGNLPHHRELRPGSIHPSQHLPYSLRNCANRQPLLLNSQPPLLPRLWLPDPAIRPL
jgi:oxygen-dependent protoporphyrinogen oxidase